MDVRPDMTVYVANSSFTTYNHSMERKIFWMVFTIVGLLADFMLPFWWAFFATIPALFIAWWVAYRSDWF